MAYFPPRLPFCRRPYLQTFLRVLHSIFWSINGTCFNPAEMSCYGRKRVVYLSLKSNESKPMTLELMKLRNCFLLRWCHRVCQPFQERCLYNRKLSSHEFRCYVCTSQCDLQLIKPKGPTKHGKKPQRITQPQSSPFLRRT